MSSEESATVCVLGTGVYLPDRVVTNEELSARVPGVSADWLVSRTGILERRYAAPEEAASDLAVHAARRALDQARVTADELDFIIVSTMTGDAPIPSTACWATCPTSSTRC
jgi:acetoacetyl-CoA synthase